MEREKKTAEAHTKPPETECIAHSRESMFRVLSFGQRLFPTVSCLIHFSMRFRICCFIFNAIFLCSQFPLNLLMFFFLSLFSFHSLSWIRFLSFVESLVGGDGGGGVGINLLLVSCTFRLPSLALG